MKTNSQTPSHFWSSSTCLSYGNSPTPHRIHSQLPHISSSSSYSISSGKLPRCLSTSYPICTSCSTWIHYLRRIWINWKNLPIIFTWVQIPSYYSSDLKRKRIKHFSKLLLVFVTKTTRMLHRTFIIRINQSHSRFYCLHRILVEISYHCE